MANQVLCFEKLIFSKEQKILKESPQQHTKNT